MIHLHVTKEVFEKIKSGEKRVEYRPDTEHYRNMFKPILYCNDHFELLNIYMGYPKKGDAERTIKAFIKCCYWINTGASSIDPLFFKYYPEYKEPSIIVVEFEILPEIYN